MEQNTILTTGIYDLIKDHLRRKKVTIEQETLLTERLKKCKQVLRRDLPTNVVTVNTKVKVKDMQTNQEIEMQLVGPKKAKSTKNKFSVVSEIGLATIGFKVGDITQWPTENTVKQYEIVAINAV